MAVLVCRSCKRNYIAEEEDTKTVCPVCKAELVRVCEWCDQPEGECKCGKEKINME